MDLKKAENYLNKELGFVKNTLISYPEVIKAMAKYAESEAINYSQCCETLKDKYEIVFEDWLKDHKFKQSKNGFHKNGIDYKVNEITWMYIQDVYNL